MANRRVVVVGAGIMGLWSALSLREAGHDVLLVDSWGSGHSRASSGGENRVIRCAYGGSKFYAAWALRAQRIWKRRQRDWGLELFHPCGVLWMVTGDESYARRSLTDLEALAIPHERLDAGAFARRFPQIRPNGVRWAILESRSGALLARRACQAVRRAFEDAGGKFRIATVAPLRSGGHLRSLTTIDGGRIRADRFVFACGPWLPSMFPELLATRVRVSHKEVFYFGTRAGDDRFLPTQLPVWLEPGADCYGVPPLDGKGFKVHPDVPGRRIDPSSLDRRSSPRLLRLARACLKRRFPSLGKAPLLETRVCQYASTGDDHLILDKHPEIPNAWLVGGGSGHAFKHGPVIGEIVASVVTDDRPDAVPEPLRLSHRPSGRNF